MTEKKIKFYSNELKANFLVRCKKFQMKENNHTEEIALQIAHDIWNERLDKYRKDQDNFIMNSF